MEKPILYGQKINLRPIVAADAGAMYETLSDKETMRLTGTQATYTYEQVEAFCARLLAAEDRLDYAITRKDDPTYIGEVILNNIDFHNRSASFRIALAHTRHFGLGYGSEATRLIIAHGFHVLKLHRIELEVYDFNRRAQHVYEKAGFKREGVRRDVLLWEGEFHSAVIMSLLAPEYFGAS